MNSLHGGKEEDISLTFCLGCTQGCTDGCTNTAWLICAQTKMNCTQENCTLNCNTEDICVISEAYCTYVDCTLLCK